MSKRLALLLATCAFSLTGCSTSSIYSTKQYLFSTWVQTVFYDGNKSAASDALSLLSRYNYLADIYSEPTDATDPNLYTLNHTNDPVTVDSKLADLLTFSQKMEEKTKGYFNPLIGNLSALWKTALDDEVLPSQTKITAAVDELSDTTDNYFTVDGDVVTRHGTCTFDLGAIAKGYALARAKDLLTSEGETEYMLNGGSSSIVLGEKPTSDGLFRVAFANLSGKYTMLKNCAIATSADYEQEVSIDGTSYTHIVNPFTGEATFKYDLCSVIGNDAGALDALSTAFYLMGPDLAKTYEDDADFGPLQMIFASSSTIEYQTAGLEIENG